MTRTRTIAWWLPALLLGVVVACKPRAAKETAVAVVPDTAGAVVAVAPPEGPVVALKVEDTPGVGVHLVDPSGHALYILANPEGAPVDCTGDCAKDWKPVAAPAAPDKSAVAIEVALIGVAPRADGTKQATYNGMPLYTYSGDKSPTDTKGQGKKAGGSTAYLVAPDGKKIEGKA